MQASTIVSGARELGLEHAACLCLRRGASRWGTLSFDLGDEATLSVGRWRDCDWPISARGVRALELYVRFEDDQLFVQPAQAGGRVRLDGAALPRGWTAIEDGAELTFGDACIEVRIPNALRQCAPANESSQVRAVPGMPSVMVPDDMLQETVFADLDDTVYVEPERAEARANGRRDAARTVPMETENLGVTAVLESSSTTPERAELVRYALLALATATAYGGWVLLLDRL